MIINIKDILGNWVLVLIIGQVFWFEFTVKICKNSLKEIWDVYWKNKKLNKLLENNSQEYLEGLEKCFSLSDDYDDRATEAQTLEVDLSLKLREIVKDQKYFSIEHIEALNVDYDMSIVVSSKNSGKTWQIYQQMAGWINSKIKFIYMRSTYTELKASSNFFWDDEASPCIMIEHGNRFYIYSKNDYYAIVEDCDSDLKPLPTMKMFKKYGVEYVGIGVEFAKANWKLGGGSYEGFHRIVFDEFTTSANRQIYKPENLQEWDRFLSSVIRNKENFKVYMYGNITSKNLDILGHYDISPSDDLRYIIRGEGTGTSRILYVNFKDFYSGSYKSQKFVQGGGIESAIELRSNKPFEPISKIMPYFMHKELKHDRMVVTGKIGELWMIHSKYWEHEESIDSEIRKNYVVKISRTTPLKVLLFSRRNGISVYSNKKSLSYLEGVTYSSDIFDGMNYLFKIYDDGELYFADVLSIDYFQEIREESKDRDGTTELVRKFWTK